jgi:hypothetical protein
LAVLVFTTTMLSEWNWMCIPDHAGPQRAAATTTGTNSLAAISSSRQSPGHWIWNQPSLCTNTPQPKEPATSEYTWYEGSVIPRPPFPCCNSCAPWAYLPPAAIRSGKGTTPLHQARSGKGTTPLHQAHRSSQSRYYLVGLLPTDVEWYFLFSPTSSFLRLHAFFDFHCRRTRRHSIFSGGSLS